MDGAFFIFRQTPSIRGLYKEWSRRIFSTENLSPRPSRRLRGQFPPKFSVLYRRRPILSASSKTLFCDVMRCFRHINRDTNNQRSSESGACSEISPQKSHSSRAESLFVLEKTPFTQPILWFFPEFLVFRGTSNHDKWARRKTENRFSRLLCTEFGLIGKPGKVSSKFFVINPLPAIT